MRSIVGIAASSLNDLYEIHSSSTQKDNVEGLLVTTVYFVMLEFVMNERSIWGGVLGHFHLLP